MALKMFGRPEIGSLWVNEYSGMAIVIGYKTDGFNDDAQPTGGAVDLPLWTYNITDFHHLSQV